MATYTQHAMAQQIPTRAMATVAWWVSEAMLGLLTCQTFVMKNVEAIIRAKSRRPAVQMFRSMKGTGYQLDVNMVCRSGVPVGSLSGRPCRAASAFHSRTISRILSISVSSSSSSESSSSICEAFFSVEGFRRRRSRAARYGNNVPAAIATRDRQQVST